MKGKLAVMLAVVIVFLATSASVFAHHGNVAYDMKDLVALKNATVTKFFLGDYSPRSPREVKAEVFIEPDGAAVDPQRNLLSLAAMRNDCPNFNV